MTEQTAFELIDFGLLIGPKGGIWVSASSAYGSVHGVLRAGGRLATVDELAEMTEDFQDAIQYARPQNPADLGLALREILFGEPEIREIFDRTRGAAGHQGRQLLVRLVAAPWRLADVPWELTLDPNGGSHQHLTLAPDAHIVRAARSRTYPLVRRPPAPPLNVLLILSSPAVSEGDDDSLVFDLFEEKRNLMGELRPLVDAGLLTVDIEEHPTLENLRRRVGSRPNGYHVMHYLGHAVPSGMILENRFGRGVRVGVEEFTAVLRLCPSLHLALFAGCETACGTSRDDGSADGVAGEWRIGSAPPTASRASGARR